MLNNLKAKFTRATINHPRKIALGTITSAHGAAFCLLPFDGGISFTSVCMASGLMGLTASPMWVALYADNLSDYQTKAHITHSDGKTYSANRAQKNAYDAMERKINRYQALFNDAHQNGRKKRLLKKAQSCADKQQWIIDGLKTNSLKEKEEHIEFKIQRGPKKTLPKN